MKNPLLIQSSLSLQQNVSVVSLHNLYFKGNVLVEDKKVLSMGNYIDKVQISLRTQMSSQQEIYIKRIHDTIL